MLKAPAYVTISLVFFILIGIVFGYSYFFYPNAHPLQCIVKKYTGKNCPACGFSRAFSNYTHFKFSEGIQFNKLSLNVFLFSVFQFFLRGYISAYYYFTKKNTNALFIKIDVFISTLLFLIAFLPLII